MGKTPETSGAVASSGYRWVLLGGVWLIYFCFGLMITSLAPLVTPITTELGIGHAKMGGDGRDRATLCEPSPGSDPIDTRKQHANVEE